jgi:hypothetical protein
MTLPTAKGTEGVMLYERGYWLSRPGRRTASPSRTRSARRRQRSSSRWISWKRTSCDDELVRCPGPICARRTEQRCVMGTASTR